MSRTILYAVQYGTVSSEEKGKLTSSQLHSHVVGRLVSSAARGMDFARRAFHGFRKELVESS
jgi:hypothetical protein